MIIQTLLLILSLILIILFLTDRVIQRKGKQQGQTPLPKTGQNFAGFWVRLGSLIIDGGLLSLVAALLITLITGTLHPIISSEAYLKFFLFTFLPTTLLIPYFYFAWFNAEGRHSPGKKLFGLAVVDTSFRAISFSRSLKRTAVCFFDIPGIWFILINKKKQALHDIFAKTYVIRIKQPLRVEKLLIIVVFVGVILLQNILSGYMPNDYIQPFRIPAGDMKPTILIGDFILVDKYWAKHNSPKQGELIVFKYPKHERLNYIKRCIAVGGQTVEIKKGEVYIDGNPEGEKRHLGRDYDPLDGRYVENINVAAPDGKSYIIRHYIKLITDKENHTPLNKGARPGLPTLQGASASKYGFLSQNENYGPIKVPEGNYFVMGDNRDNSADSRSWGFVPQKNIVGKAGIIHWSWDKWNNKIRWSRIGEALQ